MGGGTSWLLRYFGGEVLDGSVAGEEHSRKGEGESRGWASLPQWLNGLKRFLGLVFPLKMTKTRPKRLNFFGFPTKND